MDCPNCGAGLYVVHSLASKDAIYRRRKCKECGESVYTQEESIHGSKDLYLALYSKKRIEYKKEQQKREVNKNGKK